MELENPKPTAIRSYSRSRPVRIAFFVEEGEYEHLILNAIFERCFGLWGGRYNLIVPCHEKRVRPSYELWLKVFDPDIIYSYIDLAEDYLQELHETLYPSYLTRHRVLSREKITTRSFQPQLEASPLSSETLIPLASRPSRFDRPQPVKIANPRGRASRDPFILDNFGSFLDSVGHDFPPSLSEYGEPLHILADDEFQPRPQYGIREEIRIKDKTQLLNAMAKEYIVSPSQLSSMDAPRLRIDSHRWAGSFNLVIGDSFTDRISHWNSRSLYANHYHRQLTGLRVPASDMDNSDLIKALSSYLKMRNHISRDGSGSAPAITLRSHSISEEKLSQIAEAIKGENFHHFLNTKKICSLDDCVPETAVLKRTYMIFEQRTVAQNTHNWREDISTGKEILVSPPTPAHLGFAPNEMQSAHYGVWAVDIRIERENNLSRYDNQKQEWVLPRRWRMTSAFRRSYELENGDRRILVSRVSAAGLLTMFASNGSKFPVINSPDDREAFASAFLEGRNWWLFDHSTEDADVRPQQIATDFNRSENGLYFWGVYNMFGGLRNANSILLHQFWNEQFEKLGASPKRTDIRRTQIVAALQKRVIDFEEETREQKLETIADIVLEEAEQQRQRPPKTSWTELMTDFQIFQNAYWARPDATHIDDIDDWRKKEFLSLEAGVQSLCKMGVLHQGYEIKCPKCLHKSWIAIDAMDRYLPCEVCRAISPAPVSKPWSFRLNEFLREALRTHGILPLFWSLAKIRNMTERSFYFEGPVDIWFEGHGYDGQKPDTDLDLTCVIDGKVLAVEVKQSARQLRKLTSFGNVMKRVRPDVAVLAIMEKHSSEIGAAFEKIKSEMEGTGIDTKLLTLEVESDFEPSPWL